MFLENMELMIKISQKKNFFVQYEQTHFIQSLIHIVTVIIDMRKKQ